MTDSPTPHSPTPDSPTPDTTDAAQLARIAAIRARRAQSNPAVSSHPDDTAQMQRRVRPEIAAGERAAGQSPPVSPHPNRPTRTRHPATGGKILAAGLGASGLLGLMATYAIANPAEDAAVLEADSNNTLASQTAAPESAGSTVLTNGVEQTAGAAPEADSNDTLASHTAGAAAEAIPRVDEFGVAGTPDLDGTAAAGLRPQPPATPIYLAANPIIRTITVQPPPVIVTIIDPAPIPQPVDRSGQAAQSPTSPQTAQSGQQAGGSQPPSVVAPQAPAPAAAATSAPAAVVVAPNPPPAVATVAPPPPAPAVAALPPAATPAPPRSSGSG